MPSDKTICTKCKEVIFTAGDSFLPNPFDPPDPHSNVPLMDTYANGHHLGGCDGAIAITVLPRRLQWIKGKMVDKEMDSRAIEKEMRRHRKAWLGS